MPAGGSSARKAVLASAVQEVRDGRPEGCDASKRRKDAGEAADEEEEDDADEGQFCFFSHQIPVKYQ